MLLTKYSKSRVQLWPTDLLIQAANEIDVKLLEQQRVNTRAGKRKDTEPAKMIEMVVEVLDTELESRSPSQQIPLV